MNQETTSAETQVCLCFNRKVISVLYVRNSTLQDRFQKHISERFETISLNSMEVVTVWNYNIENNKRRQLATGWQRKSRIKSVEDKVIHSNNKTWS